MNIGTLQSMDIRILTLILSISILIGCSNNIEVIQSTYDRDNEIKELSDSKTEYEKYNVNSHPYKLKAEIYSHDDGTSTRLVYRLTIDEPQVPMNGVLISGMLHPELINYLDSSDFLVSNIMAFEDEASIKQQSLVPGGKIKGVSTGRGFVPREGIFEESKVINLLTDTRVKVSWLDKDNNLQEDYIQLDKSNIIIDKNIIEIFPSLEGL